MGQKVKENIVTQAGEFKWTWLDKPDTSPIGKNKYKTAIVLDKGVKANDALAEKLNTLHKSVKGKADKRPVKDGDAMAEDDAKNEWARGMWIVTGKSKDKPQMVGANGKTPLVQAPRTGDLGKLVLYATDYAADGSTGVTCYLNGVQLLERRNKGRDVSSAFADESEKYGEDTAEADTTDKSGEGSDEDGDGDGDY